MGLLDFMKKDKDSQGQSQNPGQSPQGPMPSNGPVSPYDPQNFAGGYTYNSQPLTSGYNPAGQGVQATPFPTTSTPADINQQPIPTEPITEYKSDFLFPPQAGGTSTPTPTDLNDLSYAASPAPQDLPAQQMSTELNAQPESEPFTGSQDNLTPGATMSDLTANTEATTSSALAQDTTNTNTDTVTGQPEAQIEQPVSSIPSAEGTSALDLTTTTSSSMTDSTQPTDLSGGLAVETGSGTSTPSDDSQTQTDIGTTPSDNSNIPGGVPNFTMPNLDFGSSIPSTSTSTTPTDDSQTQVQDDPSAAPVVATVNDTSATLTTPSEPQSIGTEPEATVPTESGESLTQNLSPDGTTVAGSDIVTPIPQAADTQEIETTNVEAPTATNPASTDPVDADDTVIETGVSADMPVQPASILPGLNETATTMPEVTMEEPVISETTPSVTPEVEVTEPAVSEPVVQGTETNDTNTSQSATNAIEPNSLSSFLNNPLPSVTAEEPAEMSLSQITGVPGVSEPEPIVTTEGQTTETQDVTPEVGSQVVEPTENEIAETPVAAVEIPSTGQQDLFQKIALIGLSGPKIDMNLGNNLKSFVKELYKNNMQLVIDSKDGLGEYVLQAVNEMDKKLMGIYLKPYMSNDFKADSQYLKATPGASVIYSNQIERIRHLIKEGRIFVVFDGGGIYNFSILMNLWATAKMYYGQHKPIILVGEGWEEKIKQLRQITGISPKDEAIVKIVPKVDMLLSQIEQIKKEYNISKDMKVEKVVDRRVEGDERDFVITE